MAASTFDSSFWRDFRWRCPVENCSGAKSYWRHPGSNQCEYSNEKPQNGYRVEINNTGELRCDGCKAAKPINEWVFKCPSHGNTYQKPHLQSSKKIEDWSARGTSCSLSNMTKMKDWSVKEVIEWVKKVDLPGIDSLCEKIEKNRLNGSAILSAKEAKDFGDFGISRITAERLFEEVKKYKTRQTASAAGNSSGSNAEFRCIANSGASQKYIFVTKTMTVATLKSLVCAAFNITGTQATITGTGKTLSDDNKTLEQCQITRPTVFSLITRNPGGAQDVIGAKDENRIRQLNTNDSSITLTSEKDCITLDDDPLEKRAKMKCGHAVGAQTMYEYMKSVLSKDLYTHKITCPVPNCRMEWDLELVSKVADLSDEEYLNYQVIIDQRHSKHQGYKICPTCGSKGERQENLTIFRIRCGACKGPDFCWACEKVWKNGGLQICGNPECPVADIQAVLTNCELVIASGSQLQIPKIRACPKCLTFVEHTSGCKHMSCKGCGWNFCFSCLQTEKEKGTGSWVCGTYVDKCTVAERQKLS